MYKLAQVRIVLVLSPFYSHFPMKLCEKGVLNIGLFLEAFLPVLLHMLMVTLKRTPLKYVTNSFLAVFGHGF